MSQASKQQLDLTLNDRTIKQKLDELDIDDEDDFHTKLINDVLNKGVTEGLAVHSDDIAHTKLIQLTEALKQLELNIPEEDATQKLTNNDQHLDAQQEQEQITINLIKDILVRLDIDDEEETSHDKICDALLKNGIDAIKQFEDFIPPTEFAQLVKELNEKVTITRSQPPPPLPEEETPSEDSINCSISTFGLEIDFNYFNALDSSDTAHGDFCEQVRQSEHNYAELIVRRMIYLIKRQQNLRPFIEDLQNISETISLRQLLCEFLVKCSDDVRAKCYQLLSANNPVPAIIEQGCKHLAVDCQWIAMLDDDEDVLSGRVIITRILSCGLEATCKGKSKLLNTLFSTSFEENEYECNQRFFNATLDMQMVRDFGAPGNHLCIADAHGVISEALLEKMAGAFDVILVHLSGEAAGLVKNTMLIDKLAKRVQKRVFVIVRDSKSDSYDNCCDQDAMKRTFPKLAGLRGGLQGAGIRFCRVSSLMENQARFFFDKLRVFFFDEMCSFGIISEVYI